MASPIAVDVNHRFWIGEPVTMWETRLRAALDETSPADATIGLMWGSYDSHCIQLSVAENEIESLLMRVDLRGASMKLVGRAIDFAAAHDLVLITHDGEMIEPDREHVGTALRNSDAARFVSNPREYLRTVPKISD
ncbi:MAG: hypothetical protein QM831_04145 [Kofleriaceae bacterium]